jgi:pyruvate dehydrogenase (NADP+)
MGELADAWASSGRLNCFGQTVSVREMQSEGGAAGAVHGSLSAGALTTTFTASQGLLLFIPNMYKIAGELLPCVFHVASRAIAGQALSIFGDHSDIMAVRSTGFALLSSHSVQECMDLALIAHLSSLESSVPFVHFFDGFRLSHEISKVSVLDYDDMKEMINLEHVHAHRKRALNPNHPHVHGTSQAPDIFFQHVEGSNQYYQKVPAIVEETMRRFEEKFKRSYHLFDYVGASNPTAIIICMGAGSPVVEETLEWMGRDPTWSQHALGLIKVRLFRPWSVSHLLQAIPTSVQRICVLDRSKDATAVGESLYMDVCTSLFQSSSNRPMPCVVGGRFGLGSKDFTPGMVLSCFENLLSPSPKNHFTVGIEDDVCFTSLAMLPEPTTLPADLKQCIFWGLSSDGTVGANKNAIKIIGDATDLHVQGYFSYDAHKSGGVTVSHLRFGPHEIKAHYLIQSADFVSCNHPQWISRYSVLRNCRKGGTFVLNTKLLTLAALEEGLPHTIKQAIAQREVIFYVIDANSVAESTGMGKRINNIMQAVFFQLSGVLPASTAMTLFKAEIRKSYGKKGEEVVLANYAAVDAAISALHRIDYPASTWAKAAAPINTTNAGVVRMDKLAETSIRSSKAMTEGKKERMLKWVHDVMEPIVRLEGDGIPVSSLDPRGFYPLGTAAFEKRAIAKKVPVVDMDKCTQCNYCSFVCPHAAIRPFLVSNDELEGELIPPVTFDLRAADGPGCASYSYRIQVSPLDCTGCEVCVYTCPTQALTMKTIEDVIDEEKANWEYATTLPWRGNLFDRHTVKGSQFSQPLLEFSGACEGCGETPYLKLLSQLFGERMIIANATGCSSIWGASAPFVPYTTNEQGRGPAWGNSLFEDNAEFGLGMYVATSQRRKKLAADVKEILRLHKKGDALLSEELKAALTDWEQGFQDADTCERTTNIILPALEEVSKSLTSLTKHAQQVWQSILIASDIFIKVSQWIVGGDGWAYDIGFGGLDHILASGENVNVVVLDTEMYSNTGGQKSKSTPMSSVAKFAAGGKDLPKKDLGQIAMSYGEVYVASVCLGGNFNQCVKAFTEAEKFHGVSLILCYSPCIEFGIRQGMSQMVNEGKEAVETGYWPLYRYNPELRPGNPFQLDFRKVKKSLVEFLAKENRFASLQLSNPTVALELQEKLSHQIVDHFHANIEKNLSPEELVESFTQLSGGLLPKKSSSVTILFGSQTGTAESVSLSVATEARGRGMRVAWMALDDFDVESLHEASLLLIFCSTAGRGELPDNAKDFWSYLSSPARKDSWLRQVKYAVFGLGDSSYSFFNAAAKDIDGQLAKLGAQRLQAVGMGDDQDLERYDTALEEWMPACWSVMGAPPLLKKDFPDLQFSVTTSTDTSIVERPIVPVKATTLKLLTNTRITPASYDRDIRHLEFAVPESFHYTLGDSLAIYPQNDEERVNAFLQGYGLNPQELLDVTPLGKKIEARKQKSFERPLSILQVFRDLLDLFGRPTRNFLRNLLPFAGDEKEKVALEGLIAAKLQPLIVETATIADVLSMFPSCHPELPYLLDFIPTMRARYYSIASAQRYSPRQLDLCIVIDDWTTPQGSYRVGTCTSYIRDVQAGSEIVCGVEPSRFTLPPLSTTPIIMAGLGTGIAPFRAFTQARAVAKENGKEIGQNILFYGCRYSKKDYLYAEDWTQFLAAGVLTQALPAFSRDQSYKVYIQDKISEHSAHIYDLMKHKGAHFYMCGSSGRPEKQIWDAVVSVFEKEGKMSHEAAEAEIQTLLLNGRYSKETW